MRDSPSSPVVFLATANDRADPRRKLRNLPDEARRVRASLQRAEDDGRCELILRTNAMVDEILDVFMDRDYRDRIAVFHFAGHANSYQLLFETAEGKPAPADAASLARFLAQQRDLKLVFLNGCSTEGQAQALLDAGVSVVIATSQDIDDAVATEFAERFYKGLAGGAKVREAFEQAGAAVQITRGPTRNLYPAWAREAGLADQVPWVIYPPEGAPGAEDWSLPEPQALLSDLIERLLEQASDFPEAREASARARKSLEYNCHQIKSMSEYKTAHDLLQQVEGSYRSLYDQLYDERGMLRPLGPRDWRVTVSSRSALQASIAKLVNRVEVLSFRANAENWLESLRQASAHLQAAYDRKEQQLLDDALYAVDEVISTVTSPINDRLIGTIDALRLSDLMDELQGLYEIVRAHKEASAGRELEDFQRGIAELGKMSQRLAACRQEHDAWQQLDNRLRTEQQQMLVGLNVGRFRRLWEMSLREKMLALCAPVDTGWAQDPDSWMNKLDTALATTPVKREQVVEAFYECRSAATNQFVRVNGDLMHLCDELAETGGSLEVALERLP